MTVFAFHSWAKKDLRSENIFHDVFVLNCWDLCILLVRGLLGGAGRLGRVLFAKQRHLAAVELLRRGQQQPQRQRQQIKWVVQISLIILMLTSLAIL